MQQLNGADERASYRLCDYEGSQQKCTEWSKEEAHISIGDLNGHYDAGD